MVAAGSSVAIFSLSGLEIMRRLAHGPKGRVPNGLNCDVEGRNEYHAFSSCPSLTFAVQGKGQIREE